MMSLCVLIFMQLFVIIAGQQRNCREASDIVNQILSNYDKNLAPAQKPLNVRVEFWLQDVYSVSSKKLEATLGLYTNAEWIDDRLRFSHMNPCNRNISGLDHSKLWQPTLTFIDDKATNLAKVPYEKTYIIVYENGKVWINKQITITIPCEAKFHRYPFDEMLCQTTFSSYRRGADKLNLDWKNYNVMIIKSTNIDFNLKNISVVRATPVYPAGQWNELKTKLTFTRKFMSVFLDTYIPAMIAVVAAGISFFLGRKSSIARVILATAALFFILFLMESYSNKLPSVSYLKWIDIYMFVCLAFIGSAFVELALANGCSNRDQYDVLASNSHQTSDGFEPLEPKNQNTRGNKVSRFFRRHCTKFDISAGVLYLGLFATWNVIFFLVLIIL